MQKRILFVGNSWQGSNARSLREAVALEEDVIMAEVCDDHFIPNYRRLPLRVANRFLNVLQRKELKREIKRVVAAFKPEVVMIYKGTPVDASLIDELRAQGVATINVFPDYSPHAYGTRLREAIGHYDLVISTKPFHPRLWESVYGYRNECVCVPHGYDPAIHYDPQPIESTKFDVVLCARWRPEYHRVMLALADIIGPGVSVAIGGPEWMQRRKLLPPHWTLFPEITGPAYRAFLRSGKIALALVNREVVVKGVVQPGDEDTARSYELAAAHAFFLHQRTDYISSVYDGATEAPFWSDAAELAALINRWLPDEEGRRQMAARAHARAVPAYSHRGRARQVLDHLDAFLARKASSHPSKH